MNRFLKDPLHFIGDQRILFTVSGNSLFLIPEISDYCADRPADDVAQL